MENYELLRNHKVKNNINSFTKLAVYNREGWSKFSKERLLEKKRTNNCRSVSQLASLNVSQLVWKYRTVIPGDLRRVHILKVIGYKITYREFFWRKRRLILIESFQVRALWFIKYDPWGHKDATNLSGDLVYMKKSSEDKQKVYFVTANWM